MCFPNKLKIKTTKNYKWGGDIIVNNPIVKSFRTVPGTRKNYDIDVRDFLRTNGNALIGDVLADIRKFADSINVSNFINTDKTDAETEKLSGSEFFLSKRPGSFDFRANLIVSYLAESFKYKKKIKDPWLFPEETLSIKIGDCEDFAYLLASILISSGISSYNVRVALGNVQLYANAQKFDSPKGHAWVMYKQENSDWRIIESTVLAKTGRSGSNEKTGSIPTKLIPTEIEYIPEFVFNDDHLWIIDEDNKKCQYNQEKLRQNIFLKIRKRWNELNPAFHGDVHQTLIKQALKETGFTKKLDKHFRQAFIFFGGIVDDVDNPLINPYTPLEHFDNGYIKKSWEKVLENIEAYKANRNDVFPLCKALHAVADFYAHSTYAHFELSDTKIFDVKTIDNPIKEADYLENSGFKDKWETFTLNTKVYGNLDRKIAINTWKGLLISGRYAQVGETKQRGGTFSDRSLEALLSIPKELIEDKSDVFSMRGALPHHNEIAVDEQDKPQFHLLYDITNYNLQFTRRKALALAHIEQILSSLK